ncbi:Chromo domain/shadow [Penicillium cf. griseofulvum]|uniref:Chromo domain/shadow n=1 Tax=Penicillium cf. griseofulvum TaxID=2972120 RepID=A0A9W9M594_9EURO|nr:Chromo domain/shadow [Penicillium cf. griseofulvum]KAJ5435151.1 Chromo domain/shadow [Penicillium cf. griseofulvum]KAJ5452981.1 Chromo domain/shadow [Penicillium cf. griseofulvum]
MPPPIEDMSDEESGDIPFRKAPETNGKDADDTPEDEGDEEDEDEEEGLYVVESIRDHDWLDDGTLKLLVKWKGYDKLEDHTWEEEEGLMYVYALVELRHMLCAFIDKYHREGAGEIVTAYYKSIGGRPTKPEKKPAAAKPGRKRKSMGDSKATPPAPASAASEAKRQRRKSAPKATIKQAPSESEENGAQWLPKGKNWDADVKEVDTIVREGDAGLMAWLEFNNGRKAKLSVQACYEKCPLKMLKFYESHLVFKDN